SRLKKMRKVRKQVWEDLISPHFTTRCIQTLLNVGFMEALRDSPRQPADFAREHGLNAKLLEAICEALYARRILTRSSTGYGLAETGQLIMESNPARGWFDLVYGYEGALHSLENLLRNQSTYGSEVVRDGKFVGVGSGLASLDFYFPMVRRMIGERGFKKVLDIGCGDGTFLRYLCAMNSGLQAVGLDLSPTAVGAGNE